MFADISHNIAHTMIFILFLSNGGRDELSRLGALPATGITQRAP